MEVVVGISAERASQALAQCRWIVEDAITLLIDREKHLAQEAGDGPVGGHVSTQTVGTASRDGGETSVESHDGAAELRPVLDHEIGDKATKMESIILGGTDVDFLGVDEASPSSNEGGPLNWYTQPVAFVTSVPSLDSHLQPFEPASSAHGRSLTCKEIRPLVPEGVISVVANRCVRFDARSNSMQGV